MGVVQGRSRDEHEFPSEMNFGIFGNLREMKSLMNIMEFLAEDEFLGGFLMEKEGLERLCCGCCNVCVFMSCLALEKGEVIYRGSF